MISMLSSYILVNLYQQHSEASREGSDSDDDYGDTSMDEDLEFDSDGITEVIMRSIFRLRMYRIQHGIPAPSYRR